MTVETPRRIHTGRVAAGGAILAVGLLMLLDRTRLSSGQIAGLVAPFMLISLGLSRVIEAWVSDAPGRRRPVGGVGLVLIGGWMLASDLHLFGLTYNTSWPLLLIVLGGLLLLQEVLDTRRPGPRAER